MLSDNGYKLAVLRDKNLIGFRVSVNIGELRNFHYRFGPKAITTYNNLLKNSLSLFFNSSGSSVLREQILQVPFVFDKYIHKLVTAS